MATPRVRTFQSFGEFGLKGIPEILEDSEELDATYHRVLHDEIAGAVLDFSREITGTFKRNWRSVIGKSGAGRPLRSGIGSIGPGETSKVVNKDAGAIPIDKGTGAHNKHGARIMPRGVTKPALSRVESRKLQLQAKAIARVEKRGGI
jgi:hypothetical protein